MGVAQYAYFVFCSMLTSVFRKGMSTISKPLVVFVLGGPGAGKGTQCSRIVSVSLAHNGTLIPTILFYISNGLLLY